MPGMTISEAAQAWAVDRGTVKRWIARGRIEAAKDNAGVWRIAPGQQPPPSLERHRDRPRAAPGSPQDLAPGTGQLQAELAELRTALAQAERDRDVSRREAELLRERLAEAHTDRDRLHGLLREALAQSLARATRPSWLERLLSAIRGR